jgi:hypothetical protein
MRLRTQWEHSHAASAGLNLLAMIAVILAVLTGTEKQSETLEFQRFSA